MGIMTMILGIVIFITGFGLIYYIMNTEPRHNIIIGFCGFGFVLIGFMLIMYRFMF